MRRRAKLTLLQGIILGLRYAGMSNSEISHWLAKHRVHETTRGSVGAIVTQMRGRGIEIPPYTPREE